MLGFLSGCGVVTRSTTLGSNFHGSSCCEANATNVTRTPVRREAIIECKRNSSREKRYSHTDGRRPNRVAELLRREIGPIIDDAFGRSFRREDDAPPLLISVVDVKCTDDLRSARVSISVLGSEEDKTEALDWLRKSRKEIRFEVAQCVHLKYVPELSFAESEMAAAVKTVNILNRLAQEREEKKVAVGDVDDVAEDWKVTRDADLDYDASGDDGLIFDADDDEDDDDEDDDFIINVDDQGDGDDFSGIEFIQRKSIKGKTADNLKR